MLSEERRKKSRRRLLKTARIVFGDKAPKIECTIRNMSEIGVALQVSTTVGIPTNFDVVYRWQAVPLPLHVADRHKDRRCL
jgi:hypothetical protein